MKKLCKKRYKKADKNVFFDSQNVVKNTQTLSVSTVSKKASPDRYVENVQVAKLEKLFPLKFWIKPSEW